MFKFLHAADLHLDSPLRGLERYDGAPVESLRAATRRAVENLVALALAERVAFVLVAGDVYDGDWQDYNTGLFFARQTARLKEAGIAVYLISGNHDAASVITRSLKLPDNVFPFPVDAPRTLVHEPTGAAIHGQGFAKKAVTQNLAIAYPTPAAGRFNVGLLHTSATGATTAATEHERYAPCAVDDLRRLGYDYWALGHVHLRQTLCDADATIAYSGNTQGRHMRETGPKGCLLVTVDGGRPAVEFRPLDVFRWERAAADATGCATPDDVLEAVADALRATAATSDGLPLAVRIEVAGRCEAHAALAGNSEQWEAEVRGLATQEYGEMWIEKVRFATSPASVVADDLEDGPLAELRRLVAEVDSDDALLKELSAELADLGKKLPREVRDALAPAGFDDPAWLRPLAADAGRLLLGRLTGGE